MQQEPFQISVNDQYRLEIQPEDALALDWVKTSPTSFHVIHHGKSVDIELLETNYLTHSFVFRMDGRRFEVNISDKYERLIHQLGLSVGGSQKMNQIKAPMPGMVLEILVEPGQPVQKGDALVVLEAMKMENVIKAPADGAIKAIPAKKGHAVDKGQLLIELE